MWDGHLSLCRMLLIVQCAALHHCNYFNDKIVHRFHKFSEYCCLGNSAHIHSGASCVGWPVAVYEGKLFYSQLFCIYDVFMMVGWKCNFANRSYFVVYGFVKSVVICIYDDKLYLSRHVVFKINSCKKELFPLRCGLVT